MVKGEFSFGLLIPRERAFRDDSMEGRHGETKIKTTRMLISDSERSSIEKLKIVATQ